MSFKAIHIIMHNFQNLHVLIAFPLQGARKWWRCE